MLGQKRQFTLSSGDIVRTPLLIPSFSSKGFPHVRKIIETTREFIEGPVLVSAYDVAHGKIDGDYSFASMAFLDSGGYEAGKDSELSDLGERDHTPLDWDPSMHAKVLEDWSPGVPSVVISYDHPSTREPVAKQIERARELKLPAQSIPELLLKPESPTQTRLKVSSVIDNAHGLAKFPIIGVTEKEIGKSLLDRMENIAKIRKRLQSIDLDIPIHVFGSLDTISTLMYFVSGADIFDGLTWLRFAYRKGLTIYRHNYGALEAGPEENSDVVEAMCWTQNYRYLKRMSGEMMRFAKQEDFSCFEHHSELIRTAYETVMAKVEG